MEEQIVSQGEAPAQPAEEPVVVAETQDESSPPSDTEAPAEPKKDAPPLQKRIDQLTWKAHEAERRYNAEIQRRAEAEERAQKYEAQIQEFMRLATAPTMEQVGHDPQAYQTALMRHYEQALAQQAQSRQQQESQRQEAMQRARFEATLQTRVAEGVQKYADFQEVVNNPSLPPLQSVNPVLLHSILDHEQMPDIVYFMGKNPAEAHRIANLPPARAILEVGKIAAKLTQTPAQSSKAPPPPSTVTGSNATARKDPANMSFDEFVQWRRKTIAARR